MDLDALLSQLDTALVTARKLNDMKAQTRSRELSVAITNLETGRLWVKEAIDKDVPF